MRAWILTAMALLGCGEERAAVPDPVEESVAPEAAPEPPPIPMGWAAQTNPGVRYATPPEWVRVPHISPTMVFSWQGPPSDRGRATFHLDRREHVDPATAARMGEVLAGQLSARGATEVSSHVVTDWSGAEWAEVECVLHPNGAPDAAQMLTRVRVRDDGVSLSSGCSGPLGEESIAATCRQLFDSLQIE